MRSGAPPAWLERLLLWALPSGLRGQSIVGDAREEYAEVLSESGRWRADFWYLRHSIALVLSYVTRRGGARPRDHHDGRMEMGTVWSELRIGARGLMRRPGSAVLAALILALGIGVSTFMFSLMHAVFLEGVGLPNEDRLAMMYRTDASVPSVETQQMNFASHDFFELRERLTAFDRIGGYWTGTVNLSGDGEATRYDGVFVTSNLLDMLGISPALGRLHLEGEDAPGSAPTIVLGHEVWVTRYGSDPGVVGRTVRINGETGTIVGVLRQGFAWPANHEIYVSMDDDRSESDRWNGRFYSTVGELRDGVAFAQAEQDLARVAADLEVEYPETNEGMGSRLLTPLASQNGPELLVIFSALLTSGLFVLLVACANVANLLLARAATRIRESGVRVAVGGSRFRVMLPFLSESLALSVVGAVLGTYMAHVAIEVFDAVSVGSVTGRPYYIEFGIDGPVLAFTIILTVLTAVVAGAIPAFKVAGADIASVLRDETRGSTGLRIGRWSRALVLVEVTLSCALLVGAGLMTRSMLQYTSHDYPFDDDQVFTARVGLFATVYPDREDRQAFWQNLLEGVEASPSVERAALTTVLPTRVPGRVRLKIEGETYERTADRPLALSAMVTPGFFETLGTPLLFGNGFSTEHVQGVDPVVVVNESFAERHWPGESAVGKRFWWTTTDTVPPLTVIGVAPDLLMNGFIPEGNALGPGPEGFYVPVTQYDPAFLTLMARTRSGEVMSLAPEARAVVRELDADLPLYDVMSLEQYVKNNSWFYPVFGVVFVVLGVSSVFMAAIGLYGVLAFSVSRRLQELGIRSALGAGGKRLASLVLRQTFGQLLLGLTLGLTLAWFAGSGLALLMFEVRPRDPAVYVGVVAVVLSVGLLAGLIPTRRAAKVDPVIAMRSE